MPLNGMHDLSAVVVVTLLHALLIPGPVLGQTGAQECPCVTSAWSGFAALTAELASAGFPGTYGVEGCKAYDQIFNTSGCGASGVQLDFCIESWCYIDPDLCPVNATKCQNAGFLLNDPAFPACRSRPHARSEVLPQSANAHYSYQTCGSLDNYQQSRHQSNMQGRTLIATTTDDSPYTTVTADSAGVSFGGMQIDYFRDVMKVFVPALDLRISDTWATPESSAKFSSSFTAVVNDVAVGKYDVAIADFWVTSERMLLTNFLPSIRVDNFYLVVFTESGETTFLEMIANPFKPFTPEAWGLIVAGMLLAAGSMAIIDFHDDEDFPYEASSYLWRIGKAFYIGMFSLMSGASTFRSSSLASKVLSLGFQLFLVIVMASYTANLASLLVVANVKTGVESLQDAIDAGYTVCVPVAIEVSMAQVYPNLKTYVFGGSTTDYARHMWAKKCDAAVIHLKRIDQAHRLEIQDKDCADVASGKYTEEEAPCAVRDDCQLTRVGDPVMVMPVAFPTRPDDSATLTALSWAVTDSSNAGKWDAAKANNGHLIPPSRCEKASVEAASIDWDGFGGTSFFLAVTVALALIIHFALGAKATPASKSESDSMPASDAPKVKGVTPEPLTGPVAEEEVASAPKLPASPPPMTNPKLAIAGEQGVSREGDLKEILRRLDDMQAPTILRRLDELQASIESKTATPDRATDAGLAFADSRDSTEGWGGFLAGFTQK